MGEADAIISRARTIENARNAERVPVDFRALNVLVRRQRAALTRAVNSGDRDKLVLTIRAAVREWNKPVGQCGPMTGHAGSGPLTTAYRCSDRSISGTWARRTHRPLEQLKEVKP